MGNEKITFHDFLIGKYPLYADPDIKVNLTVGQLVQLKLEHDEICNKSNFDSAVNYVKHTYCDRHLHTDYMLIGDVAELIKITTGKDVELNELTKITNHDET